MIERNAFRTGLAVVAVCALWMVSPVSMPAASAQRHSFGFSLGFSTGHHSNFGIGGFFGRPFGSHHFGYRPSFSFSYYSGWPYYDYYYPPYVPSYSYLPLYGGPSVSYVYLPPSVT